MIEVKTIGISGFEGAIRGMRMPYESFDKSDSRLTLDCDDCWIGDLEDGCNYCRSYGKGDSYKKFVIGENDMKLAKKLIKGGSEHRKFLRMIHVQTEILAPRRWWCEFDTYRFVEKNSSSTMHLITKRHLTIDDFSYNTHSRLVILKTLDGINNLIDVYNTTSDATLREAVFVAIKDALPEGFNQLREIDTNYEELLTIYRQRKNHRQPEWREFCAWVRALPYMEEFIKAYEEGMEHTN